MGAKYPQGLNRESILYAAAFAAEVIGSFLERSDNLSQNFERLH